MILETEIIDSGIGINIERQKCLFVPFQELKSNFGFQMNTGIGLGLSCSQILTKKLNGDIKIKYSRKGITSLSYKIPITVRQLELQSKSKYELS